MQISLFAPDKEHIITHDLNFQQPRYESKHVIVSAPLLLLATGLYEYLRVPSFLLYRPSETRSPHSLPFSENLDPFPEMKTVSSRNAVESLKRAARRKSG